MLEYQTYSEKVEKLLRQNPKGRDQEMELINNYVEAYRRKNHITPTPGMKFELSCDTWGEGYNLLYRQLILTTDGDASWKELNDHQVRQLVIDQIRKDIEQVKPGR